MNPKLKTRISRQYKHRYKIYDEMRQDMLKLVEKFSNVGNKSYEIFEISSRTKTLKSILRNIENKKYHETDKIGQRVEINENFSLDEVKDIAGVRITCHCMSDLKAITTVFDGFMRREVSIDNFFVLYDKVDHSEPSPSISGKKTEQDPYRGVHYYYMKMVGRKTLLCEIQIRTVLGNAWAVQSHHYLYKTNNVDGDAKDLSMAVSKIYNGIEDVWEIIKQKQTEGNKK